MPSLVNGKPKIWAPYTKHATITMYKQNIKEVWYNGDTDAVIFLTDKLRYLYGGSSENIVKDWIRQFREELSVTATKGY
jgi:hypothetical protein